jgi:phosphoglycerate dehydrogenase-like enzyme
VSSEDLSSESESSNPGSPEQVVRPADISAVVVLCSVSPAVDRIRSQFPDLEVVDISDGVPPGTRGDVLFGGLGPSSAEAMAAGVQWVQVSGTGVDGIPSEVRAAPVLTSARGASAVAISEYVIATMGAFARDFPANWLKESPERWYIQQARTLAGATLSLYGFGGIAQRVARVALALDMSVVAMRRRDLPSPVEGVTMMTSFRELASVADHLVIAAPATDETRHVLNDETLDHVRTGVHLVNIARGSLVDQDALRRALDDGRVGRASLDVTTPEPLPVGHWMFEHPKVFLTPHASWAGETPLASATEYFCRNLERYLAGQPLEGVVGPDGY